MVLGHKKRNRAVLSALGIIVLVGIGCETAGAGPLDKFPPDARQVVYNILRMLPPDGQQQALHAIQMLSPAAVQRTIDKARAYPPNLLGPAVAMGERIRRLLPPAYQQRYVNGMWGVSPADEQFANEITEGALAAVSANSQVQSRMIQEHMNRMGNMQIEQYGQTQDSLRRQGQRSADVLGGDVRYGDPGDRQWGGTIPQSTVPSVPTRWWRCNTNPYPVPSDVWPGSGCYEVPAPR